MNLVNTVADNRIRYSERDYSRAVLARKVQKIIGRPSTKTFMSIVDNNQFQNCPVKREDIVAAERIFGPEVGSLMGKTVRKTPTSVNATYTNIPATILSRYHDVTVAGDIMFVNKMPFFVTISRHIKFRTSEFLANQKTDTIYKAIKHVHQTYTKRGFKMKFLLMDGQFDKDGLAGEVAELGITMNCVAAEEHVPEIERGIRTIKDRARSVVSMLPFKQLPARIVIELIHYCVFWLNSFPAPKGISDSLSPRAIVVGSTVDYAAHCKLEFGSYVQTHEPHDNSMLPRTTGAIALRPTGNDQGGHYFYSLTTGRRLNRNQWTELPMPADVVDRVHRLSRRNLELMPLEFANRAGVLFPDNGDAPDEENDDDDADDDYIDDEFDPDDAPDDVDDWIDGQIAGVDHDDNDNEDDEDDNDNDNDNDNQDDDEVEVDVNMDEDHINDDVNDMPPDVDNVDVDDMPMPPMIARNNDNDVENAELAAAENVGNDVENAELAAENLEVVDEDENADDAPVNVEDVMDIKYGTRLGNYNLRARKPRDYSHIHATLESIVMTQHSVRKGLRIFGEAGVDAVLKELMQLYDREVLEPKSKDEMTAAERQGGTTVLDVPEAKTKRHRSRAEDAQTGANSVSTRARKRQARLRWRSNQ